VPHPDDERFFPEQFGGKNMGSHLHFAYLAMLEFQARHKQLPQLHSDK